MEKPLACGTQRRSEKIAAATAAAAVHWQGSCGNLGHCSDCCSAMLLLSRVTVRVYADSQSLRRVSNSWRGEARRGEARWSSGAVKAVASPVTVSVILGDQAAAFSGFRAVYDGYGTESGVPTPQRVS